MGSPLPISVVVPTIGRLGLLRDCASSLVACQPRPAEVLIVDQSGTDEVADGLSDLERCGVRVVACHGRGIARGTNLGLRLAAHDTVAVTHDDCVVSPDWVSVAAALASEHPGTILTGSVRPLGDDHVPSSKSSQSAEDFTGRPSAAALYPANMVLNRVAVLAIGAFDERPSLALAAEDNDLCYRWLKAGGRLRYQPELVVWHQPWRSGDAIVATYATYGRGSGAMYAKHLRQADLRMAQLLLRDLRGNLRPIGSAIVHRRPVPTARVAYIRGLAQGFRREWSGGE